LIVQVDADWPDIALRLLLSAIASAAIGINRGEAERPVGLRTTMLVTLAAAISMVQVNLLLPVAGKAQGSFVVVDLMRLPLGILSGMGFIGAGAIIRRDSMVQGVTTAATLWFTTVMGLCFGGGQITLGLTAFALAIFVLWPLKWAERWAGRQHRGLLSITTDSGTTNSADLIEQVILPSLAAAGFKAGHCAISIGGQGKTCTARCEIEWHEVRSSRSPTDLVREFVHHPDIAAVEWVPQEHL
jgi:putative Mg2+ transporter-C (MgtC) family protein